MTTSAVRNLLFMMRFPFSLFFLVKLACLTELVCDENCQAYEQDEDNEGKE